MHHCATVISSKFKSQKFYGTNDKIYMFIQHGKKEMFGKTLNSNISSFIKLPPFAPLSFLLLNVKSKDEEQISAI